MKFFKYSILTIIVLSAYILAAESDDIALFEKTLEEATEIATKTKLNADYVPGTVNVISGAKLKSLGITNLADPTAFDMIVGFDSSSKSMRGAGSIYGSQGNKIKWMINDKPLSSEIWGTGIYGIGDIFFPIPIDFVERIEIIRGPGSAIYGDNAIYGVVNIVTFQDKQLIFSGLSKTDTNKYGKSIGAYINFKKDELNVNLAVSTFQQDGFDANINSNNNFYNYYNAKYTPGFGPGNLPNANAGVSIIGDVNYKDYNIWLYKLQNINSYAQMQWNPTLPLPNENDLYNQRNSYLLTGIKKEILINSFKVTGTVNIQRYDNIARSMFIWPSNILSNNTNNSNGYKNIDYAEQKISTDLNIIKNLEEHRVLSGIFFSKTEVLKDLFLRSYSGQTFSPNNYSNLLTGTYPKRYQKALYIQDEATFNDFTITSGIRYDTFSDNDSSFSPRLAAVYRHDDYNTIKCQYSRAFRPPSMIEMYAGTFNNEKISPEIVDTIEVSYIFKNDEKTFKSTIFKSFIKDMITFHDFSYETLNLKNSSITGIELEAKQLIRNHEIGTNLAFYNTHKDETPPYNSGFPAKLDASEFALSAKFQGNFFAILNANSNFPTTIWYHYISSKPRMNNDVTINGSVYKSWTGYTMYLNGSTPPQDYLNITQKIKGLAKGLELDFGVKNAFGKTLKTLYMPLNPPNNQDIPYMRQTFWFNASYKF